MRGCHIFFLCSTKRASEGNFRGSRPMEQNAAALPGGRTVTAETSLLASSKCEVVASGGSSGQAVSDNLDASIRNANVRSLSSWDPPQRHNGNHQDPFQSANSTAVGGQQLDSFSSQNDKSVWSSRHRVNMPLETNHSGTASLLTMMGPVVSSVRGRVYQLWHYFGGQNRFFCWGRCVTGPKIDLWFHLSAWFFILVPVACYFYFAAYDLWTHVSPALPVFTGIAFFATVVFMLLTSCTDPGIIPRHSLQTAVEGLEEQVAGVVGAALPVVDVLSSDPVCPLTDFQTANGFKWCTTCKVIRPPRASHCRDCDNCILVHDHHCPFVNNCIGQRNYPFFMSFLFSTVCLGGASMLGIVLWLFHERGISWHYNEVLMYSFLGCICVPASLLTLGVLGLGCFHMGLACRGRTTREVLGRGGDAVGGRTLCNFRGPSLIRARERIVCRVPVV
eukprot:TRINITY_DN14205_c0_g1_i1.p1 TRINITY_DN14205_c0_g1~~TRINITY_DN14205_c0_g1_i1.p1  ORF type:complete len:447 (-),score=30.74 TRINITY_DN14205_c0_g1_i1:315-1655(-)